MCCNKNILVDSANETLRSGWLFMKKISPEINVFMTQESRWPWKSIYSYDYAISLPGNICRICSSISPTYIGNVYKNGWLIQNIFATRVPASFLVTRHKVLRINSEAIWIFHFYWKSVQTSEHTIKIKIILRDGTLVEWYE